jgi:hypothetical protein
MNKISNKIDVRRNMFGPTILLLAMVLTITQCVLFTGNQIYFLFMPLILPMVAVNCIMEWNFDFKNATYAEKRQMVIALNNPINFGS